jgi:hypothetical protein
LNDAASKVQRVVLCHEEFLCGKFLPPVFCCQSLSVLSRAAASNWAATVRLLAWAEGFVLLLRLPLAAGLSLQAEFAG